MGQHVGRVLLQSRTARETNAPPRVQTHALCRGGTLDRAMGVAYGNRSTGGNDSAYASFGWGGLGFSPTSATSAGVAPPASASPAPAAAPSPCATGNFSPLHACDGVFAPDDSAMYQLRRAGVFGGVPQPPQREPSSTVAGMTSFAGR